MNSVKLSSNYQIAIPLTVRQALGLQKGQTLYIQSVGTKDISLTTESPVDAYYGKLKGAWTEDGDVTAYQRTIRSELER